MISKFKIFFTLVLFFFTALHSPFAAAKNFPLGRYLNIVNDNIIENSSIEFFKDGSVTFRNVDQLRDFSTVEGNWVDLDDGRIKVSVSALGTKQSLFLTFDNLGRLVLEVPEKKILRVQFVIKDSSTHKKIIQRKEDASNYAKEYTQVFAKNSNKMNESSDYPNLMVNAVKSCDFGNAVMCNVEISLLTNPYNKNRSYEAALKRLEKHKADDTMSRFLAILHAGIYAAAEDSKIRNPKQALSMLSQITLDNDLFVTRSYNTTKAIALVNLQDINTRAYAPPLWIGDYTANEAMSEAQKACRQIKWNSEDVRAIQCRGADAMAQMLRKRQLEKSLYISSKQTFDEYEQLVATMGAAQVSQTPQVDKNKTSAVPAVNESGWIKAVTIAKDKTNIRSSPTTDASTITQLVPSLAVEVKQSTSADWFEIRPTGGGASIGFLRKDRVTLNK
jgi:hypothetical protein